MIIAEPQTDDVDGTVLAGLSRNEVFMGGGIRRIKRSLNKPKQALLLADTKIKFNNRPILIAVKSNIEADKMAKDFTGFMDWMRFRSNQVNMGDFYKAQQNILEKMNSGLNLVN